MNDLTIINLNGQLVTESREVAEMVSKRHSDLMRDIKGYKEILDQNANLRSADFFIEHTYKNDNNQSYPCYLLTRKGCDMVANKMTGEKGVLFTAAYVTKFEEMEKQLKHQEINTQALSPALQMFNQLFLSQAKLELETAEMKNKIEYVEKKQEQITEILSLNPTEWRKKVNAILNKISKTLGGFEAYQDIRNESYKRLEERARCSLSVRLTNKKQKMALEGVAKSKIDKVNKMDVIADDARLTEIYLAIVKEMAIQYQVEVEASA